MHLRAPREVSSVEDPDVKRCRAAVVKQGTEIIASVAGRPPAILAKKVPWCPLAATLQQQHSSSSTTAAAALTQQRSSSSAPAVARAAAARGRDSSALADSSRGRDSGSSGRR